MNFRVNPGPYNRSKNSTLKIMLILTAALLVVWLCGVVYSFVLTKNVNLALNGNGKVNYGVRSIVMMVLSVVVSLIADVLFTLAGHKKTNKTTLGYEIKYNLIHNYSYVSAIIFTLTLPVYASYYVVIIGSLFATVVVKHLFGGFGKNIFNPAALARIFVALCFGSQMKIPEVLNQSAYLASGLDAISGQTLTTTFNNNSGWLSTSYVGASGLIKGAIFSDYSLLDIALGKYLGSIGETFTILILVIGVVLAILKVINYRTPLFYLGTVALSSLVIALVLGFSHPLNYVLYHLCLGGLMFGAIFMLTDPVTGPTSNFGKCLIGVIAGLLTVLIRIKGSYPEGVVYSIAVCNLLSPAIDYLTKGKSTDHTLRKSLVMCGGVVLSVLLTTVVAFKANGGKEVYDINGIDAGTYARLENAVTLEEGYSFKAASYSVKTSTTTYNENSVEYSADGLFHPTKQKSIVVSVEGIEGTSAYYEVIDSNSAVVAKAYVVKTIASIGMEHDGDSYGAQSVTSYGLVIINNNGTVYGYGSITEANTNGYANIATTSNEAYKNATIDQVSTLDFAYQASSSYSSNIIKAQILKAFEEFNA